MPSSRNASPISRSSDAAPALAHPAAALAYKLAIAPLLLVQAIGTRRRALVLPEAAGPRDGSTSGSDGEPLRLLIAGDSSAAGVGVAHQDAAVTGHLVRGLQRRLKKPICWSLRAKSGLTTRGLHRLLEAAPPADADIAVIITGVNDVVDQIGAGRAVRHRAALADWLLASGHARHIVFAPLPPIHRFPLLPEPLRAVLGRDARRHDRLLADWAATRRDVSHAVFDIDLNADTMASDGFHPGEPVYRACGEGLAAHVASTLASS